LEKVMPSGGYYTQDEAVKKLALTKEQLVDLVREDRIQEFRIDGQAKYKVSQIDSLADEINPSVSGIGDESDIGSDSAIELLPADASDGGTDVVSLEESHIEQVPSAKPGKGKKEDTVITPAGVSVFDEDELAGLDADPMAKTQIAPSLSDELSIEGGSGGGSGLLDMTRESDDTSLGAELLDEIYSGEETQKPKGQPKAEKVTAAAAPEEAEPFEEVEEEPVVAAPRAIFLQNADPMGGLFSGLLIVVAALMAFSGVVGAGISAGVLPGMIAWLAGNFLIWIIVSVVLVGAGLGVGYLLGKKAIL
jgi:hypothetical protein